MTHLSSRERMLAALRYQQPDYVPLIFNVFGFQPPPHLAWSNQVEQAQRWLSLGVDATLELSLPLMFHPHVEVREWEESVPGKHWPLMVKEYHTPAGILRQEVFRTDDWVSTDWPAHQAEHSSVALFDDFNVSRSRKFLIESDEDLDKLKYLLCPLPDDAIARFCEEAAVIAGQAKQLGVLLEGQGSQGVDALTWLCGIEGMVFLAMDQPEMFNALLDIVHDWDKHNVKVLLDTPIELVTRRGWYEGTAFWSPALFRRFFLPRFRELTDMVHQADRLMGYRNSTGFMPLLDAFVDIGYDTHIYIDPVMGGANVDLRKVKSAFEKKIAVIGGVNSAVTLERGSRDAIRHEVFEAVETLGPGGGLVLTPVDCISASTPWVNIEILIDAWKEIRNYPLQ